MLRKRYENNGKPVLMLNRLQIKIKEQIDLKVSQGIYSFESVPCCVCNSEDFEALSSKDRYGLYYPVVICKQCGLIQTNPRMNQESYNSFYNCEFRKLYVGEDCSSDEFLDQYLRGKKIYSYLRNTHVLSRSLSEPFVFEVGCGVGGILQYFKERGCTVQGIDLCKESIEFGRMRYGLDLSAGTIADASFDKLPDIIIYSHVLEHMLFPKKELVCVNRILSQDGIVYFEMPGVKNLRNIYEVDFLQLLQNAHTYHFTLATLRNLLESSGFQLVIGDETIRSVFKKSERIGLGITFENDYEAVMAYLNRLERFRRLLQLPYMLKRLPRSVTIKALKVFGMYNFAKKAYWKLKGPEEPQLAFL